MWLLALIAALVIHPFHPVTFDGEFYHWCLENTSEDAGYCCVKAGGAVRDGLCWTQAPDGSGRQVPVNYPPTKENTT